jgi:hypothetical protein
MQKASDLPSTFCAAFLAFFLVLLAVALALCVNSAALS